MVKVCAAKFLGINCQLKYCQVTLHKPLYKKESKYKLVHKPNNIVNAWNCISKVVLIIKYI